jgi:hypothetical protein
MPQFLSALMLALLLTGCNKLSVENYDKLETGMPYEKVTQILGAPAACDEVLGIKICRWGDEKKKIVVNFVGGTVVLTSAENIH